MIVFHLLELNCYCRFIFFWKSMLECSRQQPWAATAGSIQRCCRHAVTVLALTSPLSSFVHFPLLLALSSQLSVVYSCSFLIPNCSPPHTSETNCSDCAFLFLYSGSAAAVIWLYGTAEWFFCSPSRRMEWNCVCSSAFVSSEYAQRCHLRLHVRCHLRLLPGYSTYRSFQSWSLSLSSSSSFSFWPSSFSWSADLNSVPLIQHFWPQYNQFTSPLSHLMVIAQTLWLPCFCLIN